MRSPNAVERASHPAGARPLSAAMNEDCVCSTLNRQTLGALLQGSAAHPDHIEALTNERPHLASHSASFLSVEDAKQIEAAINAIEAATRLPAYRKAALGPAAASSQPEGTGVFAGYDFHITPEGPRLIEINTNAGGAFLNALILKAQDACCPAFEPLFQKMSGIDFERAAIGMFMSEWRALRGRDKPLRRIAIVDDAPEQQYLYPELLIAKRFFEKHGVEAVIVDAGELTYAAGKLLAGGKPIDLVYNRLVDFSLSDPSHSALAAAYRDSAIVVTPNPRHHALLANKRNLALLSDARLLRLWGLSEAHITALHVIPHTEILNENNADALWNARKDFYFKPADGFGSKAVYRGAKLTKSKWAEISIGGYVAQRYVKPGERIVTVDGERRKLKMDVRFYAYNGELLLAAARLYQGQTTNFRTPGGGFSPVLVLPDSLNNLLNSDTEKALT